MPEIKQPRSSGVLSRVRGKHKGPRHVADVTAGAVPAASPQTSARARGLRDDFDDSIQNRVVLHKSRLAELFFFIFPAGNLLY